MATNPQQELVYRAQSGSREAFASLVRMHQRLVRTYVGGRLHDRDAAEDVAQDVFLCAFREIEQFRGDGDWKSWLMAIARNCVVNHLRTESRRFRSQGASLSAALAEWKLQHVDSDISELEAAELQLKTLRECMDQLAPHNRQLIDQFYLENQSAEAIGQQMNRKPGTVRMTLLRLRTVLRQCMQQKMSWGTDG